MKLSYISLVILFHKNNAFSSSSLKKNTRYAQKIRNCHQLSLLQSTSTKLYSEPDSGGDGWFDDYDDFVDKLDFEGGGWDSGADSPFDGDGRSDSYSSRGRGGGRGRGGKGRGRGRGMTWDRDFSSDNYGSKGHDYIRDTTRDTTPVDEAAVNRLLADRLHYRKKRMFDAADDMRDELLNVHGVTVWDKDRTWTTGRGGADTRGGRGMCDFVLC